MAYQYQSTDGRTVISPNDLSYAATPGGRSVESIALTQVNPKDEKLILILPATTAGERIKHLLSNELEDKSLEHQDILHYCVMDALGEPHIMSGKKYVPVSQYLTNSDPELLHLVIDRLASQAALLNKMLYGERRCED